MIKSWWQRRKQRQQDWHEYKRGQTKIESDEIYALRRRVSDLEERIVDLDLIVSGMYNAMQLGAPTREFWVSHTEDK